MDIDKGTKDTNINIQGKKTNVVQFMFDNIA